MAVSLRVTMTILNDLRQTVSTIEEAASLIDRLQQRDQAVPYLNAIYEDAKRFHDARCELCPDHNCSLGNAIERLHAHFNKVKRT